MFKGYTLQTGVIQYLLRGEATTPPPPWVVQGEAVALMPPPPKASPGFLPILLKALITKTKYHKCFERRNFQNRDNRSACKSFIKVPRYDCFIKQVWFRKSWILYKMVSFKGCVRISLEISTFVSFRVSVDVNLTEIILTISRHMHSTLDYKPSCK